VEIPAPPYTGNSRALDQACLLNKAKSKNSPLCSAISYVKTSLSFPVPGGIVQKSQYTMLSKINIFQEFLPQIIQLQNKKVAKLLIILLENH